MTTQPPTASPIVGADVAKAQIVVYRSDLEQLQTLPNQARALARWLKTLPLQTAIAVEATGSYHFALVDLACRRGHPVYLIDGYRLSHYRKGLGGRAKTDPADARLLARYLAHERAHLRPWTPPPPVYRLLQRLLRRRAVAVKARVAVAQSAADDRMLQRMIAPAVRALNLLIRQLEQQLLLAAKQADLTAPLQRCQAIEGIGPLTATALVMAFLRGEFRHSDAFIAFLGLDVRVRDSGTYSGRRRLSKQGDAETRRLLHNAAMAASRTATWKPVYQRYVARGMKRTQALVALARKLARVAFALLKHNAEYQPRLHMRA